MSSASVHAADRIARWRTDFDVIYRDVQDVAEQRDVYREVVAIATANPALEELDGRFWLWLAKMHAHSAAVAVRKQVDRNPDTVSLRRLLEAIALDAHLLTRADYLARADDAADPTTERGRLHVEGLRDLLQDRFDGLAGSGKEHLEEDNVRADLARLETASERVKRFVNKTIAHRDRAGVDVTADWADLNGAIDTLMQIVRKYNELLDAARAPGIVPVYQHNWTAIFRIPWIQARGAESRGNAE